MTERLSGWEVCERVLQRMPFSRCRISLEEVHRKSEEGLLCGNGDSRFLCMLAGPSDGKSLDLMRLRWMNDGGVSPVLLAPSTPQEIVELGIHGIEIAKAFDCPVFVLVDNAIGELESEVDLDRSAEPVDPPSAPPPPLDLPDDERVVRAQIQKFSSEHQGLQLHVLDRDPDTNAKPEWLVISYSEASNAAQKAVNQARDQGVRVNHLMLKSLLPVPEPVIMRHAMGIKHVVVAERNQGELAMEVRRMLPQIGVIPAAYSTGPVPTELVLERLMHTPRCC